MIPKLLVVALASAAAWCPIASADVSNGEIQQGCSNFSTAGLPACPNVREAQANVCRTLDKGYDWRIAFRDLYNYGTTYHDKGLSMMVVQSAVTYVCPSHRDAVPDNDSGELDGFA